MPPVRNLLAAALLGLGLLFHPLLPAAEAPSAAAVQKSLDGLAERQLAEAEQQALRQVLESTLQQLAEKADSEQKLAELRKQLAEAPRQVLEAQRELARLKDSALPDVPRLYAERPVEELEQLLAERNAQLGEWQRQLAAANSLIVTAQTRPERAQAEISEGQARSLEINNLLKLGKEQGKPLSAERRDQLNAELAALAAKAQLRREELAGNSQLQDLGRARHDLLEERIRRAEQETLALQSLINDRRREQSERAVAELAKETEDARDDDLLARESAINLKLSDYLLRSTERLNDLTRLNLETKQRLDNLSQSEQALSEQIDVLQGSLLLSRLLYQQKQALPKVREDRGLADEIADIRLYQFEINQQREQLSNPETYVKQLLAKQAEEQVTPELRSTLGELIATRSELLERLNREMSALLNESINLQLNQKQLQATASSLRATLEEQMFWIPSNRPLDMAWLKSVPELLEAQLASVDWGSLFHELGSGLADKPLVFLPLLVLFALLLWRRGWLKAKLVALHQDVGHYKRDSQLHTPLALFINLLLALPGTLLLALAGFALQMDARGQNAIFGAALYKMAMAWLVFYTAYRILAPSGVAELHFHWPRHQVAFLRSQIRRLGVVVLALAAVVTVAERQPEVLGNDVIGISVVLVCYALLGWLTGKLLYDLPTREHVPLFRQFLGVAIVILPVVLFVAVCAGYYYTALKLSDRLLDTFYLVLLWLVLEATARRSLGVAARRLAYQRALGKRQQAPGSEEVVEEPVLDIEQINQQSLRLTSLSLMLAFIAALYWVWADLISVFAYLDNVTLYEYSAGSGAAATMVPISLADLLGALAILAITIILARNLPGLLEVLVLSRLSLAQGTSYAATSLLSYAIIGFGAVSTLGTLGVSWDKLQWLVAALSVGIGFGMQAIFANFISGLILLFERPVRIGDTVTIGGVTGTINRIRIRATHITDSDRKEVIVPNQTFLTSQLINWTLTDTVTRVVLTYNVNRGPDLELVRKLLLQATQENPRVLREPAPSVQLKTYGPTVLEHELKIYVRELGDRGLATDELNRRIDQLFQEHGINVATVPKMDVTLINAKGEQRHLDKPATEAPDAPQ